MDTIFSVHEKKISPFIVLLTKNKITKADVEGLNRIKNPQKAAISYATHEKFLGITCYAEGSGLIIFRFKNYGPTYKLFFWKRDHKIECSTRIIDDMTYRKSFPVFNSTNGNWFVSSIGSEFEELDHLIENIKANKFHLPEEEMDALRKLTPGSNPVIVLYECWEEMKSVNN